jgi:pyruvate formate lyase activating enzyme
MEKPEKYMIFQGFSIQDGPGIRTTVFSRLPPALPWFHSPESQEFYTHLSWISRAARGLRNAAGA